MNSTSEVMLDGGFASPQAQRLYQYSGQFLEQYYKLTRGKEHKKVELNAASGVELTLI